MASTVSHLFSLTGVNDALATEAMLIVNIDGYYHINRLKSIRIFLPVITGKYIHFM